MSTSSAPTKVSFPPLDVTSHPYLKVTLHYPEAIYPVGPGGRGFQVTFRYAVTRKPGESTLVTASGTLTAASPGVVTKKLDVRRLAGYADFGCNEEHCDHDNLDCGRQKVKLVEELLVTHFTSTARRLDYATRAARGEAVSISPADALAKIWRDDARSIFEENQSANPPVVNEPEEERREDPRAAAMRAFVKRMFGPGAEVLTFDLSEVPGILGGK
jgi:hypothetical protein